MTNKLIDHLRINAEWWLSSDPFPGDKSLAANHIGNVYGCCAFGPRAEFGFGEESWLCLLEAEYLANA